MDRRSTTQPQPRLGAIEAGAAGLNFEDWDERGAELTDARLQAERIDAIRAIGESAGVRIVINARTDVFLRDVGENDDARFAETVARGNRYVAAGAACVFVPGVSDESIIGRLVEEMRGPVSVLAAAGSPSVERLAELGVARISVGSGAMSHVLAQFRNAANAIKNSGDFEILTDRIAHAEVNALLG